jgi:hypothetical protein
LQRFVATLLLAIFSFPLMASAISAPGDSKAPACCRREGKHHCGMANTDAGAGVREKCPNYPLAPATPAFSNAVVLNSSQVFFASIVKHPAIHAQTEALQRIAFSRSRQKRGPPVLFS